MSDQEDLIRKISGLLAKAEGTDNEHEASAFFDKAHELMLKHMIDEQRVREAQGVRAASEKPVAVDYMYSTSDSNAVGKVSLLNIVARANRVRLVKYGNARHSNIWRPGNSGIASQWGCLVGFASDIELVKTLYVSFLVQGARFGHTDWTRTAGKSAKGKSKFMTGYLYGFGGRLRERFAEMERKVEADSRALIVRRDEEVNAALGEKFPALRSSRNHRIDFAGNLMGRAAGDRADMGTTRVGAGRRAIGSGS